MRQVTRAALGWMVVAGLVAPGCGGGGATGGPAMDAIDLGPGKDRGPGTDEAGDPGAGEVPSPDLPGEIEAGPADGGEVETGPLPGTFGWPCTNGETDCASGFCVPSDQGMVCTMMCYEECPPGWACSLVQLTGSDTTYVCLQTSTNLCRPCMADSDCASGTAGIPGSRCVAFGDEEGSFCGLLCADEKDCPEGYGCLEVKAGRGEAATRQCLPDSGMCDCSPYAIQVGAKTACARKDEEGHVCVGQRVCTAEGLGECDAPLPVPEVCDGVDNDCDGTTDEDAPAEPCEVSGDLGTCQGWTECRDGQPVCMAPPPSPEVCDGVDNDCNGTTDDGFEDTDGDGTADCVDADDDDDGVPDDKDNCPKDQNADQKDFDKDGLGNACDPDDDDDDILDEADNCVLVWNPDQADADGDGKGDECDEDDDDDGVFDAADNCPLVSNPDQVDTDADGKGDACDGDADGDAIPDEKDNCPVVANQDQADLDLDGEGDACDTDDDADGAADGVDNCPRVWNEDQGNTDGDSWGDACDDDDDNDGKPDLMDNCPTAVNPDQKDMDLDSVGDVCDPDLDGDGVHNEDDNCPDVKNAKQEDFDTDGMGDPCDPDDDNDAVPDVLDNCQWVANPDQGDLDKDQVGDACDADLDGDGVVNELDNCPAMANPAQGDQDGDSIGDVCDPDLDGDGVANEQDNCPTVANGDQTDTDVDGQGDACDADDDNDGVPDLMDNCPLLANADQANLDGDEQGDACDADDDNDEVLDGQDNCPKVFNPGQDNFDKDSMGDSCDPDDDNDGDPDTNDCAPTNPAVFHGAQEVCNGVDDNCVNGVDEEGADGCETWHYDSDGDGYGTNATKCLCAASGLYRADKGGDCNDSAKEVNPGATEKCNGVDDNCDGTTDPPGSEGSKTFFKDHDKDGFGVSGDSKALCSASGEYTATQGGDCNDNHGGIHPGATETCNGADDNCDGSTDPDGSSGCTTYFADEDNDSYGGASSKCKCSPAYPYTVTNSSDCCDKDNRAKPGQTAWYTSTNNCGSWDYNCNSNPDKEWDYLHSFSCAVSGVYCWCQGGGHSGWRSGIPGCGQTAVWRESCSDNWFCGDCNYNDFNRTQGCH